MNRRRQIVNHQQQRIHQHAKNSNAHAFFKLLADPELLQRVESVMPKHRQRLFTPTETLSMFLAQAMNADRSCQNAVNDFSIKRCCDGLKPSSVHTGAYCKARTRLPVEMVSTLLRSTGSSMSHNAPPSWRWMGRPVRPVDGTTVTMPDTAANQNAYPQSRGQKAGLGFPICRCFKHSLQLCLALRQYGTGKQDEEVLKLLQLIARKRVGNRPSRIEPRAVKRRPKPYPKLMQARGAARAEVRKNGHPKKVK